MKLANLKKIHLVGIGGINVSAIAKLLAHCGAAVSGSDLVESEITAELRNRGITVNTASAPENIKPDTDLLIYSEAVPADNPERLAARAGGIKEMSAFQFWGGYARSMKTIAVSGTNGKSTTTAMIGLILEAAGFDPTVVVGARVWQWNSNLRIGKSSWLVIEADEYHGHMLEFKPHLAVVTNLAADHLDYYRDLSDIVAHFKKWIGGGNKPDALVLNADDLGSAPLRTF